MASIELEDLIKQSVTQLNCKLTVEKERDNCIILSSTGFGRGKAMPNGRSVVQNASLIRSIIMYHGRTVVPSMKTFIVMLTGLVTGGGTGGFTIAKPFTANGVKNPNGRTDEGSVKTVGRHIKEIDGKIDTLVNKFCLIHWVPLFRLHHKKFAVEDPLEPQTVQDRRAGIFALNVVYGPTKAKLTFVLATNELCWEDSGGRTGTWSEQLSAEVLEKSILGLVTPIRQGVMTKNGDDGGLFSLPVSLETFQVRIGHQTTIPPPQGVIRERYGAKLRSPNEFSIAAGTSAY
ncbi:hypothetical protein ARMSODRAFT_979309 [Armillaria solidipes]|uniref:Uncharacterized protein n=1 Tax=Armillaria solidipes TaxID=1076256 RepID=A0A2H3AZX7_9AGAR|nr:hypothetical protein ARMSODRAFT_979309 [Armillaria solidipes]